MKDKIKYIAENAITEELCDEIISYLLASFSIFTDVASLKDHIKDYTFRQYLKDIVKGYIEL